MSKIAVVILNFNGISFLRQFLGITVKYSDYPGTSIWLVDNGSDDSSADWTTENFPEVNILKFDRNYGFAGGYNLALEQIEAEYYVLLNSDIEVTPGWLTPMVKFLDNNNRVAAVQPKILSWHRKEYFEYAGACGGFIDRLGYPFCRGRIFDLTEKDSGQYDNITEIFWASGACSMIRAAAWKDCGGFDADFFAHMEEIDLCWRMNARGWKLFSIPQSTVYHVGGGTLSYNSPVKIYLNFRNNLFLLYKNLPEKNFKITLFKRKLFDGLAAILFLLKGKPSAIPQIIKAHRDYYKKTANLKNKRLLNLQAAIKAHKISTILNRNLVFEFYLRRNSTFTSLKKYFNLYEP